MVLSEQDKKILLDRLKAGREKKRAERAAAKKTTEAKVEAVVTAEVPVSAPAAAQETAPVIVTEEQKPSEPPRIDPSKPRKPAKQVEPSSDSDSEVEQENKKKSSKSQNKKKNVPYMKIKIYAEPRNPEALNALIGAVQQEEQAVPVLTPPPLEKQHVTNVIPKQKMAAPIVRQNTMRSMAMDIFG